MFKKVSIKEFAIIVALVLALAGCAAAVKAAPDAAAPITSDVPRTITVVGLGKISLSPDMAQINLGAEASASTVAEAKAEVERQMAAILTALQGIGVESKDIQTSYYSIYYEREPVSVGREDLGTTNLTAEGRGSYRVSNMLLVTVRNVDKAGDVLDAVVEAGANQIYGVNFTVSDETRWQSEARVKAMADATARAAELAGLAGVELGQVLSVSEVIGGSAVPMMADRGYGGGGIQPGELELGTQLQVVFAIK